MDRTGEVRRIMETLLLILVQHRRDFSAASESSRRTLPKKLPGLAILCTRLCDKSPPPPPSDTIPLKQVINEGSSQLQGTQSKDAIPHIDLQMMAIMISSKKTGNDHNAGKYCLRCDLAWMCSGGRLHRSFLVLVVDQPLSKK